MMYSIGHSNQPIEGLLNKLIKYNVEYVADVRSFPRSIRQPWFDSDSLSNSLADIGVEYLFLGSSLGGRPKDPADMTKGIANYEVMAAKDKFKRSIDGLLKLSSRSSIALLCSEHNPLDCHRCLLVSRAMIELGEDTNHILRDSELMSQKKVEQVLAEEYRASNLDLFMSEDDIRSASYKSRSEKIAYSQAVVEVT